MAKTVISTKKNIVIKGNGYLEYIALALIALVLLVSPFYRGLYFRENYIPATLIISLIFTAYLAYKLLHKDYRIIDSYLDLAVLAIPICYFISFLFGVNAKDGLDAVLLYSSYFMLYKMASDMTKDDEKKRELLLNMIIVVVFIIGLISMLSLFGLIEIKGAVEGNRLFGPYQYPNTTASVLGAGIILALNALINSEKLIYKLAYQATLTTLLSAFIFTLSRGAYLTLVAVLFINFIMIDAKGKMRLIINVFISAVAGSIVIFKFYANVGEATPNMMPYYLLGILMCTAVSFSMDFVGKKIHIKLTDRKINFILITVVLIFIAAITLLFSIKEPVEYKIEHLKDEEKTWKNVSKYIDDIEPDSVYTLEFNVKSSLENPYSYGVIIRSYNDKEEFEEIYKEFNPVGTEYEHKQIEFKTLDDTDRILLLFYNYETDSYTVYKDIVIKDSNDDIVEKIKRFKYIPDAIANRLMNINLKTENASLRIYFTKDGLKIFKDHVLIGSGGGAWKNLYRQYQTFPYNTTEVHNFYIQYAAEVGLLGLFVLAMLLIQLAMGLIKSIKNKTNYLPIYLAVLLILLHSTIDFNLSLTAAAYTLWVLIGLLGTDSSFTRLKIGNTRTPCIGLLVLSFTMIMMTSSIYYGIRTGDKAAKLMKTDKDKAAAMYEKAIKLDRFNAAYRIDYAQIMSNKFRSTKDMKTYNNVLEQISKINKYEPYNSIYTNTIINLMLSNGLIDEAVSLADSKVKKEPMMVQWYMQKIEVNYEIAKYYFSVNQHTKAIPYLENIIEAKEEYESANARALKPIKLPQDYDMKTDLALNWIEQAKRNK